MSSAWADELKRAREQYRRETAGEATETEIGAPRAAKIAARREKIARLAAESPFEGERASARARLAAFDHPTHAENDRMQRGGNWNEEA